MLIDHTDPRKTIKKYLNKLVNIKKLSIEAKKKSLYGFSLKEILLMENTCFLSKPVPFWLNVQSNLMS